jgi:hypothetical protein
MQIEGNCGALGMGPVVWEAGQQGRLPGTERADSHVTWEDTPRPAAARSPYSIEYQVFSWVTLGIWKSCSVGMLQAGVGSRGWGDRVRLGRKCEGARGEVGSTVVQGQGP